jgi:hypothetical protein
MIDINLKMYWMKEGNNAHMWFLHLEGARTLSTPQGPIDGELRYLRQELCLPKGHIDLRPVAVILFFVNHYFVAVLDYAGDAVYVYGRHIAEELAGVHIVQEEDWLGWRGNLLWLHLPKLFQWERCSPEPGVVISVNWPEVTLQWEHLAIG